MFPSKFLLFYKKKFSYNLANKKLWGPFFGAQFWGTDVCVVFDCCIRTNVRRSFRNFRFLDGWHRSRVCPGFYYGDLRLAPSVQWENRASARASLVNHEGDAKFPRRSSVSHARWEKVRIYIRTYAHTSKAHFDKHLFPLEKVQVVNKLFDLIIFLDDSAL